MSNTLASATLTALIAVAAPDTDPSPNGLGSQTTLTGNWGDARPWLVERGIEINLVYGLEVMSVVAGGARRGTDVLGNVDLTVGVNLERFVGWPGAEIFLYGLANHGTNPSARVGDLQGVSNIAAPMAAKLYEAWLEQRIAGGRVALLVGLYDLNTDFQDIPSQAVFAHSSFGIGAEMGLSGRNGPSIFPATSLGARLEVKPLESLYWRLAVMDGVPGDPGHPATWIALRGEDGLLAATEIGWVNNPSLPLSVSRVTRRLQEAPPIAGYDLRRGYYAKYGLGAWGYSTSLDHLRRRTPDGEPVRVQPSGGVYAFGDHCIYFEDADPTQGLAVSLRLGIADGRVNPVDRFVGGALVYRGLIPGRDHDQLGLGVAAAHSSSDYRAGAAGDSGEALAAWEVTLELTYGVLLAPWLRLKPDLQLVLDPGGRRRIPDAWVLGARTVVAL